MRKVAKTTLAAMAMASMISPALASGAGWWTVSDDAIKTSLKRMSVGGADRMRAFALCSVKRNPKAVEALLATRQESVEERAMSRRLTQASFDCLPSGDFTLGGMSVRGSLAEAMFWTSFAGADVESLTVRSDEIGEKERFADCAVDGQLAEVRDLIATAPKSDDESAALSPLMPRLRDCIAKTSFSSMDNASARSLMAEALYRAAKRGGAG
ncbi:hypothetical protein [Blastomonas sp.]|uniref:hypothetical protein n=1 Tax=Blastomonas sp. TaxID=1909299 RepID=UPI00391DFF8E